MPYIIGSVAPFRSVFRGEAPGTLLTLKHSSGRDTHDGPRSWMLESRGYNGVVSFHFPVFSLILLIDIDIDIDIYIYTPYIYILVCIIGKMPAFSVSHSRHYMMP